VIRLSDQRARQNTIGRRLPHSVWCPLIMFFILAYTLLPDEGIMAHSSHTVILDRRGNLAAKLERNEFTADQLGDLVQSVMGDAPAATHRGPASE